jgi:hypothetical protein
MAHMNCVNGEINHQYRTEADCMQALADTRAKPGSVEGEGVYKDGSRYRTVFSRHAFARPLP